MRSPVRVPSALAVVVGGLLAAGCSSSTSPVPEVWVAGEKHAADGQRIAVVWRDGVATSLPPRSAGDDASAVALAIDGANAYAAGVSSATVGGALVQHPGYWRNGSWIDLPTLGGNGAAVASVVAQGGVVRLGGQVEDPATGFAAPGIWTDGAAGSIGMEPGAGTMRFARLPVPAGSVGGEVLSLRVVDGALVAAGFVLRVPPAGVDPDRYPATWRNGVVTEIPLLAGAAEGFAVDVCTDGGVTFVIGQQRTTGVVTLPGYWRDGTWVELPRAAPNLPAAAGRCVAGGGTLVVSGGRTATVGPVWVGTGGYWSNGEWTTFSDPTHLDITEALDVAAWEGVLYVSGAKVPGDVLTHSVGGYWRGMEWVELPVGPGEWGSLGNAIVVRVR